MIDLTQLTQEQRWGLSYANKIANDAMVSESSSGIDSIPPTRLTDEEYAESVFRIACNSYYLNLIEAKRKSAIQKFDSLPPSQQAELLAQLQVPDILPSE